MTTDVDVCNRSLQMAGARETISAIGDGSNLSDQCSLLYDSIRDQVLGMADWNFARKTIQLNLIKAAPGSQMAAASSLTAWSPNFPAPPWMYEYVYPSDCIQVRYVTSQPGNYIGGVPIFSTPTYTYDVAAGAPPQRFVTATDTIYPWATITNITQANPAVVTSAAHGFSNGNTVYITGLLGMVELNGLTYTIANVTTNTFELVGIDSSQYQAYQQNGVATNQSGTVTQANVILTNALQALGTYTLRVTDINLWQETSKQALISALAGFLAIPISGDKTLAKMLVGQANDHILNARATDGNESLTLQEYTPDWIRIRGGESYMQEIGAYTAPYPPLFGVF